MPDWVGEVRCTRELCPGSYVWHGRLVEGAYNWRAMPRTIALAGLHSLDRVTEYLCRVQRSKAHETWALLLAPLGLREAVHYNALHSDLLRRQRAGSLVPSAEGTSPPAAATALYLVPLPHSPAVPHFLDPARLVNRELLGREAPNPRLLLVAVQTLSPGPNPPPQPPPGCTADDKKAM